MSAELNCSACEELRQSAPNFTVNGIGDDECTSLANDTGLNPSSGHNDCTDLNNLNDCLVGNMATEVKAYDVCEWKEFMKNFIPNLWTTLKAMICAICGIWTNIHNLWDALNALIKKVNCILNGIITLINTLNQTTQGQAFVRYYRDNSGTGEGYEWNVKDGASHTLDIYMDANVDYAGSAAADRDYVVIIQNCTDIHNTGNCKLQIAYYSSGDTRSISSIRKRQAQHPAIDLNGASVSDFSWTNSCSVLIRKGEHIKVNSHCHSGNSGYYRLHQFVLTWIPVNAGNATLDPNSIIPC